MMKLVAFPPSFGLPSSSPFGMKAICFMNMAGVDWEWSRKADPRKAPKGKLPLLIDGGARIPDSEDIRAYLEQKTGLDFDAGLNDEQRAISRAVIRMCDEHLYFVLVCERWLNDANWEIVRETFFGMIPRPLRGFVTGKIRKKVRDDMYAQGIGRHSPEERMARADKDIGAIATLIGEKRFLFGDAPSAADASAGPMLASIAALPTESALRARVAEDAPLMAYLDRVRAALYPD